MGAQYVAGAFTSSDWRKTIEQLQEEDRLALVEMYEQEGIDACEEYFSVYSGTISSIDSWYMIEMHNKSEAEIWNEIEEENDDEWQLYKCFDKWEGVVAEGAIVGYELYTPKFVELKGLPFSYKEYIDLKKGEYSLLECIKGRKGEAKIGVVTQGDLKTCKNRASIQLYHNTDKVYIICCNRGGHYKCFNTVKKVKSTSQNDEIGKLRIKSIHNYYYAGLAGC